MNLFRYQRECVAELDWFGGRALLALPPGLGKTVVADEWLRRHPEVLPAAVVCPATVKFVWARHCRAILGREALVLDGRRADLPRPAEPPALVVVNYDVLSGWLPWLRRLGVGAVVADECQYAVNPKARRTRALASLCRGVPHVLALSGTPLVNRPAELWPVLSILRPDAFRARREYLHRYCGPELTPWGWQFRGSTHPEELHRLLAETCMVRRTKEEALPDLPPKLRSVVPLPLSDPAEYAGAEADFLGWLRALDEDAARRAARAEAVQRVGGLLRLAARLKTPAALEWCRSHLDSGEKLVVAAWQRGVVTALAEGLADRGALEMHGGTPRAERERIVDAFQHDPARRVIVGNIQTVGVGVTLTASRTVAFAELSWRPGDLTQAEDRCHRVGATGTVLCRYLIAAGTVEERMLRIVRDKQRTLDAVLDGREADNGEGVFDELIRDLRSNDDGEEGFFEA